MPNFLLGDSDESSRNHLERFLKAQGHHVEYAPSQEHVIARLAESNWPSMLIVDLSIPAAGGLEVLAEMKRRNGRLPTIVLAEPTQMSVVVKALRLGADGYLVKPLDECELDRAIHHALDEAKEDDVEDPCEDDEVPSRNKRMLCVREIACQIADTDVPVIILGESGVGKEVLARYIHSQSGRRTQPFVKVNCAALPEDLLESELFGYERGAFTGALRDRPGRFALAGKGTILLDEIGEMSPRLQAKLLHVLQDGEYVRLGGSHPIRAQARILAATNQSVEDAVYRGTFREDLYYRLNVIRLEIAPLRERREDISPLYSYFFEKYCTKYRRPARCMPPEVMALLQRYSWPGNVRQLENVVKRLVILPDSRLAVADLVERAAAPTAIPLVAPVKDAVLAGTSLKKVAAMAAEQAEKELILQKLQEVNWNRKQVARELGISYKALLNRLRRWQVGT